MNVPRETLFADYLALIERWGVALNLTSRSDRQPHRLRHHLADSLAVAACLPAGAERLIDMGSGQGFPAIPIAIQTGIEIELIEADRRKAAFLTSTLAQLGLRGRVWPVRIEDAELPPASVVTARALADLSMLLGWSKKLLTADGACYFLKSDTAEAEIAAARAHHQFDAVVLGTPNPPSCLVKITALR